MGSKNVFELRMANYSLEYDIFGETNPPSIEVSKAREA